MMQEQYEQCLKMHHEKGFTFGLQNLSGLMDNFVEILKELQND